MKCSSPLLVIVTSSSSVTSSKNFLRCRTPHYSLVLYTIRRRMAKQKSSITVSSNIFGVLFISCHKNDAATCWGIRLPHARTGGVLIVVQRRLKLTDTIFYVVRQNRLHPRERESILLEIRERIQNKDMEEEDHCCHCSPSLSLYTLHILTPLFIIVLSHVCQ
jgi:hypothetical protein